jgi:glycosyltransferase involved in cell wall biosynthesis
MRFGAGMQNKIVQAMALGKAVVATKIGAEGIAATDGVHLFVADTPSDFAKRVMELLANQELRLSMGVAAREFACRKYSTAVVAESLFALVDQALSNA